MSLGLVQLQAVCLLVGGLFLSCLSFGMRDLVLGTEGPWMEPDLGVEKDTSGELSQINIP